MEHGQKLVLISKIFDCVPSFKKVADFLSNGKLPKLLTDDGDRGITTLSNDITIISYPFVLSLCKIFVRFIFLLNLDNHFPGKGTPNPVRLKVTSHCLSPMDVVGSIKCNENGTRNFGLVHNAHTTKTVI